MGCWNEKGFISGLPINHGDDVVCFICCMTNFDKDDEMHRHYTYSYASPINFPIFAKYNDYGSIYDSVQDANLKILENYFEKPIVDVCKIIERSFAMDWSNLKEHNHQGEDFDSLTEKLEPSSKIKIARDSTHRWFLLMEHKSIYELMVQIGKQSDKEKHRKKLEEIVNLIHDIYPNGNSHCCPLTCSPSVLRWGMLHRDDVSEEQDEEIRQRCEKMGNGYHYSFPDAENIFLAYQGLDWFNNKELIDFAVDFIMFDESMEVLHKTFHIDINAGQDDNWFDHQTLANAISDICQQKMEEVDFYDDEETLQKEIQFREIKNVGQLIKTLRRFPPEASLKINGSDGEINIAYQVETDDEDGQYNLNMDVVSVDLQLDEDDANQIEE